MDNAKEKEIDFKPSNWLYIFLFIYYSIWLLQSYGAISHYITFGFDSFQAYDLVEWLCFGLFIVVGIYSLYAVIKTLRGDKDCITSLKWSLILVFVCTLIDPTRVQIPAYDIATRLTVFLVRPLFYLAFYLYLCFAKGIKRRFPKAERKFGPSGWVWVGLMIAFLGVAIYGTWQQYEISRYCRPVDLTCLNLNKGEVCDGYVLFSSDREWVKCEEGADTLYIDKRIETLPTIMSADSASKIYISSGRCDKADARTYNQVIVTSLGSLYKSIDGEYGKMREVAFVDTIVSGNRVMSTIYETTVDSISVYFDVVMITEVKSPKCSVIVRADKMPIATFWAADFAKDVQFDLQKVAQGKDNEKSCNAKNKDSHRTAKRKQQTEANMFAPLFHRIGPRHLLGIMTLKYDEREVTYRKSDRVFYNL
ncbi:MAG: hypothetical protein K2O78_04445 [Muribaculaceae bacterium]|nr:hypothetical protein [Muribaculaceae bacterium]